MNSLRLTALAMFLPVAASASVIFGKDNTANRSDPGTGVPWRSVGRALGPATDRDAHGGCVVYLGDRFVLTAEHVQLFDAVTFDETTTCALDPDFRPVSFPRKIDLKIFRLRTEPGVPGVALLDPAQQEDFSPDNRVWHVGFGVGRVAGATLQAREIPWGGRETSAKRWSVNVLRGKEPHRDTDGGSDYAYEALFTVLGLPDGQPPGLAENEGGIAGLDSGSALFQQRDGVWYLIGIAADVARIGSGTSLFGNDLADGAGAGDKNYFVRLQTYRAEITTAMTRRQWPHLRLRYLAAGAIILLAGGAALAWCRWKRAPWRPD